jgi:uncharacterized membrane protein
MWIMNIAWPVTAMFSPMGCLPGLHDGSEAMQRIAVPRNRRHGLVHGAALIVIPAIYALVKGVALPVRTRKVRLQSETRLRESHEQ